MALPSSISTLFLCSGYSPKRICFIYFYNVMVNIICVCVCVCVFEYLEGQKIKRM